MFFHEAGPTGGIDKPGQNRHTGKKTCSGGAPAGKGSSMTGSFTTLNALLEALARAMNLVNPQLENHHQQTAYLAFLLARAAGMDELSQERALCAALLHDVGSIISEEQESLKEIELQSIQVTQMGAQILFGIPELEAVAEIIHYCQLPWNQYPASCSMGDAECVQLARISSIVHLADNVSTVLTMDPEASVLNQMEKVRSAVAAVRGKVYSAEAVDAFEALYPMEFFWFDMKYHPSFLSFFTGALRPVSLERAAQLTQVVSHIIDYRSSFTAMHSAGVAASAEALARLAGMTPEEQLMMRIAGNLHDVGKLKVPRSILEKPGKLTDAEFNVVKEHPYYTRVILMDIPGFERIADWAGYHHEKLNGRGYPFHFGGDRLDLGCRIMAVADIFSAITEERPYRAGMPREQAQKVLLENVASGATCEGITTLLLDHYDQVDAARDQAARQAGKRYFDSMQ